MANQPNEETSRDEESGQTIHEDSIGRVRYRIYRNVNKVTGVYYRIKFLRREWNADKTEKWLAKGFFREDLVDVAKSAMTCHMWLVDNVGYVPGLVKNEFPKPLPVQDTKDAPVYEFQLGDVLGTVWENTSRKGNVYHKFYFHRGEQIGGTDVAWNSFRPEDMFHLAQATTHCRLWLSERLGETRGDVVTSDAEKKRPAKQKPRRAANSA